MSQKFLRFGLHDFLNAQPLLVPLLNDGKKNELEMVIDVPSALAESLKAGTIDMAMIPTVEYLKEADRYRLIPGVCIASRGKVGTVLLVSKVPIEQVKTVALDFRSRTSIALLKILFGRKFNRDVVFDTSHPDPAAMLNTHDAALIIGDQGFSVPKLKMETEVYDLSEEWFQKTGKTFVHAVLAVREEVTLDEETCEKILSAKQEGLQNISSLVRNYAGADGMDLTVCEEYLRNKIIYDLGEQELEGMTLFRDLCFDQGLLSKRQSIRFVGD